MCFVWNRNNFVQAEGHGISSVSHVIFTQLFISLSSLLAKTESKSNVDSGRKMMEAVKVGHNGGILACDVRYKTKCQNNP